MLRSESLEQLCRRLPEMPFQWEQVLARCRKTHLFTPEGYKLHYYVQAFSEAHLDLSLEAIAHDMPSCDLTLQSLQQAPERDYSLYFNRHGRVIAVDLLTSRSFEYDKVAIIDGLPVVFEMKLRRWDTGRIRQRKANGRIKATKGDSVKPTLRPEIYTAKLHPLRQYTGDDVGYVVIIPRDLYEQTLRSPAHSIASRFVADGGFILPFYTDRMSFREEVAAKVREYGLPLRQETRAEL